ncbi:MAG: hypothetical protein JXA14_27970 [Anaerolineae bacterium]|nr:hypothetical protein [Anaerolineae bacterium]
MPSPVSKSEQRWAIVVAIAVVAVSCLPYLAAWLLAPDGTRYTGLLINHYDGHSYYAKMQQGARGDWLFHLPFTHEPHEGAFIFTFYLALGHIAGALHLPIPLVYHVARAAAGFFLLLVGYHFTAHFFRHVSNRRLAFLLLALSAGLGWLMAPLDAITADLWVAEGFTFLSILANPHFPLAIGLMLLLFMPVFDLEHASFRLSRAARTAVVAAILAVVQPFAVPVVLAVLGVYLLLLTWRRGVPGTRLLYSVTTGLGAAPVMIYDLYIYTANPALAAWGAQNVTPSLPPWSYLLGYGLVLLLALFGTGVALRRREQIDLFLLAWFGTVALLLYVPFALQRRFITGFHVPLVLLAAVGLERVVLPRLPRRSRTLVTVALLGVTALTNVFVPIVPVVAVTQGQPPLVIPDAQAAALDWLADHTAWTDTVLAPTDVAHLVPAWAGNRVVYGHPFETIEAGEKKAAVEAFFAPDATPTERAAILARYGVRYVLVTGSSSIFTPPPGIELVWTEETVALYRTGVVP